MYYPVKISHERREYIRDNFKNVFEVTINTKDKTELHGWIIKKDFQSYPTIVYFGGNAEEVSFNIEDFSKIEMNFILINYRGYGLSKGTPTQHNLFNDSDEIYNFLVSKYLIKPDRIYVAGRSLGSGIAVYLSVNKNVKKTILITPFDSIEKVAYNYFPKILVKIMLKDKYKIIDICEKLANDVLLIVAEKDDVIPPKHAENLYEKINCSRQIQYIKNANHNNITFFPKYWESIKEFIAQE